MSIPDENVGAFVATALQWLEAGWHPLPCNGKVLMVTGFSGGYPHDADEAQIREWVEDPRYLHANVALRLPDGLIGIDIDQYKFKNKTGEWKQKNGYYNLRDTALQNGLVWPLSPTVVVTSRDKDKLSGIRLYKVPPGIKFKTVPCNGVEIIQRHHRYLMAPPSIHPDLGTTYKWYDQREGDGSTRRGDILDFSNFPELA